MMREMAKCFWKCNECDAKTSDLKSVLNTIKEEISTIKKGQEDQLVERERVLEGLKVVESVAKKVEHIDSVQAEHTEKLEVQEEAIKKNAERIEEGTKRTQAMEERLDKLDSEALNIRQTNAVVREIREIEKREKNLVFCNIPEAPQEEAEERKRHDEVKVGEILKELKVEAVKPTRVLRVGVKGRYPRKVLAVFQTTEECERILKQGEEIKLDNDIFLARDRTYNQRQEARLYRMEKEREERGESGPQRGRGRGRGNGRGPGRPRGRGGMGSVRGRGTRGNGSESQSRKRRNSDDEVKKRSEEEAKRRRTTGLEPGGGPSGGQGNQTEGGEGAQQEARARDVATSPPLLQQTGGRPGTPVPASKGPLSAAEGQHDF